MSPTSGFERTADGVRTGRVIYLDHASTTPTDPAVVAAMLPWYAEDFGNPSTVYSLGLRAARAVQVARVSTAATVGVQPEEISASIEPAVPPTGRGVPVSAGGP